jgi:hypothetical protein
MKYVLEQHRFFPYVAWTLVIGFVIFTYTLTIQLTQATSSLKDTNTQNLQTLERSNL